MRILLTILFASGLLLASAQDIKIFRGAQGVTGATGPQGATGTISDIGPTQVYYADTSGAATGDEGFTRTATATGITTVVGDTFVMHGNGSQLYDIFSVAQNLTDGSVITDNTNFASTAYNSRNGFWLGDHIYGTGYFMPKADGTNHQAIITNGAGQTAWQQINYSWLTDTPTIPTYIIPDVPTYHFSNGITATSDTVVKLGGTLTQATTLNLGTNSFNVSAASGGLTVSGATNSTALSYTGNSVILNSDSSEMVLLADSSSIFIRTPISVISTKRLSVYTGTSNRGLGVTDSTFLLKTFSRSEPAFSVDDSNEISHLKSSLGMDISDTALCGGGFYIDNPRVWGAGYYMFVENGVPRAQLYYGTLDSNNVITDRVRIEANPDAAHGRFITDTATGKYNGWHVGADYAQLEFAKTGEDGQASGINLTVDSSGVSIINAGSLAFKVNTTGSKISAPNIPAYANNTAAVAAIGAGKLYYTDVAGEYVLKLSH